MKNSRKIKVRISMAELRNIINNAKGNKKEIKKELYMVFLNKIMMKEKAKKEGLIARIIKRKGRRHEEMKREGEALKTKEEILESLRKGIPNIYESVEKTKDGKIEVRFSKEFMKVIEESREGGERKCS